MTRHLFRLNRDFPRLTKSPLLFDEVAAHRQTDCTSYEGCLNYAAAQSVDCLGRGRFQSWSCHECDRYVKRELGIEEILGLQLLWDELTDTGYDYREEGR